MLGYVYGDENGKADVSSSVFFGTFSHCPAGDLSPWQSTGLKVAAPVGSLVGQVVFGCLADILGRRRICE